MKEGLVSLAGANRPQCVREPTGSAMVTGLCCVLLTWSDKNCSAFLLPEMSRGENCVDAFFSWGSNFKTDLAVVRSKQASLEILYSALVLPSSLTRNKEGFASQFAVDNLAG